MSLVFALKMLGDLCYFVFAISSVAGGAEHSGLLITSPLIVALATYFSCLLWLKKPKKAYLRFLPILLCAGCFFFTKHPEDYVVTIPMIVYLFFVVYKGNMLVGYDSTLSQFFLCLKLLPLPMILMVIANNYDVFTEVMLIYFMFFLVINVMLLRMLRHNEKVFQDRKFRLMNVGEIAIICGVGYLLSSGYMMTAFKFIGTMLIRYIVKPVLTGIVYVFGGFAWVLNKIFGGIDFNAEDIDLSGLDSLGETAEEGDMAVMEYYAEQGSDGFSQIATYILIGVAAIIVIIAVILLFRAFMKYSHKNADNKFEDTRESIAEEGGGSDRLTHSHRDRVRAYYRKFLKLCFKIGVDPDENLNSLEINSQVKHRLDKAALAGLRGVYIRARYSSSEIDGDDVRAAKDAYEAIKKS